MLIIILFINFNLFSYTLQEIYDNANSYEEYDRYLILSNNNTYTGGLGLYEGNTYINCNGAIIDLQEGNGIWIYADENNAANLDIEECIITNSLYYGLSYSGQSTGSINNCNLINTNFGIKLFDNTSVIVTNSIFSSNNSMGISVYTENPNLNISYSLFWDNEDNHLENCPGWGNIWTQFELNPGIGIIYNDPEFIDSNHWNFNIDSISPCINSGNPNYYDSDGSISDIGALPYTTNCLILGDINNDAEIDVLDIVVIINCIFLNECYECSDLNDDGTINILDIVDIVNIIIN